MTQPEPPSETEVTKKVAENVVAALAWRRISARSIGEHLGMSSSATGRRMTGDVAFRIHELAIVAWVVGVSLANLVEGEPWKDATEPVRA